MLHDKTEPKCELREGLKSHRSSNSWQVGKFVLGVRITPANTVTIIQTSVEWEVLPWSPGFRQGSTFTFQLSSWHIMDLVIRLHCEAWVNNWAEGHWRWLTGSWVRREPSQVTKMGNLAPFCLPPLTLSSFYSIMLLLALPLGFWTGCFFSLELSSWAPTWLTLHNLHLCAPVALSQWTATCVPTPLPCSISLFT